MAFIAPYVALAFFAQTWWQAVPLAVLLGFATAGIGLSIQHDGGHDAFSSRPWIDRFAAMPLDFIGGSSYTWHLRRSVIATFSAAGFDSFFDWIQIRSRE